ncbi:hypothetical protein KY289_002819 [Solanum tuberosum]|nr:hypothetical protein KY289_002819 [Solanum tuberosum]
MNLPLGVAQWLWLGLGTLMLEVSSSKPLASESKGFAFWVELVAPGLPSAGYLSYVVCELLHRRRGFTLCAPKGICQELFDEKKPNISSHAVGLRVPKWRVPGGKLNEEQKKGWVLVRSDHPFSNRSQTDDNFTSYFGEVPPILDYFDCQTYPKNSQESSILSSHRQFNEHYQSHHHNNQLPTDQFVMNRPDVSPTSRHVFIDASTNGLNYVIDYSRCVVPRLHQSSYHSGREVVEQEHRQSRIDYPQPQVIRPAPYTLYDPRYADIGLPVDPYLRAMKLNPHFSMQKATSEESSTTKRKRTDYACNRVPRLHQSSSHSGREVVEPEHRQSRIDYPQAISPPFEPYDPRYAAMGLPMDPYLRAFKLNPNLGLAKPNE